VTAAKKDTTGAIVHDAPVSFPAGETHWGSDPVAPSSSTGARSHHAL